MEPRFQVSLKIRRPVAEVFDAVVDPKKLTGYFIKTSTGPLAAGATVKWSFAEAPEPFDVKVSEVVENRRIVFDWPADGGYDTRVWMSFEPLDEASTMVRIEEGGWPPGSDRASHDNAGGWMHMLCCLKAYLEYGINLRAGGAF